MDLGAILFIRTIIALMSSKNGTKFTKIIDKLFANALEMKKVDCCKFWVTMPYDIYIRIINFSC